MNSISPLTFFLIASFCAVVLAAALPFALWYYLRAKEIAPLLEKKASLEAILEKKRKDIDEANDQYDKIRDDIVQGKDIIAQAEIAKKWLEENRAKIEDLHVQVVKAREEYEIAKNQLDDYKGKVSEKQTELAGLTEKLLATEEKLSNIEKEHRDAVEKLEEQQSDLKSAISTLQIEKESLAAQVGESRKELLSIQEKVKDLEAKKDMLAKEIAELQAAKNRNAELKTENAKLEGKLGGLTQRIADAESLIAKANTIRNNEANMWRDLERNVDGMFVEEPGSARPLTDELKALGRFQEALDKSGYAFNERTIKAFHTGLLCGNVSPLVVLSGISGTGKSLLPELYAKAFGMNFLPVAVQPRWDGPQDVFGFYNHMEERFKATELSRLLWQFDVYNNPDAKAVYKNDTANLPMSLVLLDEMNLARVEYYFSELLSKLEIRNHKGNPENNEERIPSEIELEYGASSVADRNAVRTMARRLYVGHNILFVGTMNEDESTQTLSSKVIDRSNVLRFGTPDSLKTDPDFDCFKKYCDNFISFKTWQSWARPYGENLACLDDAIKKIKEALKVVDRGFGHRTEKAIKQYVDFYPGNKQDALADQIEMKVLPKLNGVETDVIRDKVKGPIIEVLQRIGDKEVGEALDETLASESTFFNWKGVRR